MCEARRRGEVGAARDRLHPLSPPTASPPQLLRRFRDAYPLCAPRSLRDDDSRKQLEALAEGAHRRGHSCARPSPIRSSTTRCWRSRLPPRGARLASARGRARVSIAELSQESFILFSQRNSPLFYGATSPCASAAGSLPRLVQNATQIHHGDGLVSPRTWASPSSRRSRGTSTCPTSASSPSRSVRSRGRRSRLAAGRTGSGAGRFPRDEQSGGADRRKPLNARERTRGAAQRDGGVPRQLSAHRREDAGPFRLVQRVDVQKGASRRGPCRAR